MNFWDERRQELAEAYSAHASEVRFRIVTRAIEQHCANHSLAVVDIGGGYGRQSVLLARRGHSVVIVDSDPNMLELARINFNSEPASVRSRVRFVLCKGEEAPWLLGSQFDIVCCHSVLMYIKNPSSLLCALVKLMRPGGLLSILSANPLSGAVRSGLQRHWRESLNILIDPNYNNKFSAQNVKHSLETISSSLATHNVTLKRWYGVGIFSDHLTEISPDEMLDLCELEWIAGKTDPYRLIARCFHALFVI